MKSGQPAIDDVRYQVVGHSHYSLLQGQEAVTSEEVFRHVRDEESEPITVSMIYAAERASRRCQTHASSL